MRYGEDNWDDPTNGSKPKPHWITMSWSFPDTATPPDHFELVLFTGSDPTNTSNYLIAPQTAIPPTVRQLIVMLAPNVDVTGITFSVRSVYV